MHKTKEEWAFSMLSDVQELLSIDLATAHKKINDVKAVLEGHYTELEGGFMIQVNRGPRAPIMDAYIDEMYARGMVD